MKVNLWSEWFIHVRRFNNLRAYSLKVAGGWEPIRAVLGWGRTTNTHANHRTTCCIETTLSQTRWQPRFINSRGGPTFSPTRHDEDGSVLIGYRMLGEIKKKKIWNLNLKKCDVCLYVGASTEITVDLLKWMKQKDWHQYLPYLGPESGRSG